MAQLFRPDKKDAAAAAAPAAPAEPTTKQLMEDFAYESSLSALMGGRCVPHRCRVRRQRAEGGRTARPSAHPAARPPARPHARPSCKQPK